jgi:putative transcriptional regulator
MIRIRFRQLLEEKAFKERRRISLGEVIAATGISRATVNRISNTPGYNANLEAIDALCTYFDCEPGELLARDKD